MSLIIAYVGKKGCVMASDKRKIAYFGNKDNLEILETELYDGSISSDEELQQRASQLDITLKITDDGSKLKTVGDTVVGEVSSKGTFETKRKRVYGTTNGYQIIEMLGSEQTSKQTGEKAIILFGNNFTKTLAQELINKKWKSSLSLKYMGEIFQEVLATVSQKTPSIGDKFDVAIKQPEFTPEQAQKYLDETIDRDVKLLAKFRKRLEEDLLEQSKTIQLAAKIINNGEVGEVSAIEGNMLEVKLNNKTQAFDGNWKQLAKPNGIVVMFSESDNVKKGDKVIIDNEKLCLEKDKSDLKCNIILCSL